MLTEIVTLRCFLAKAHRFVPFISLTLPTKELGFLEANPKE